jgi:predicted RNA binding protein YcfA (HicA-like mRNA interferase family)
VTAAMRFEDACKIAEMIGFSRKSGQGSHVVYGKEDDIT